MKILKPLYRFVSKFKYLLTFLVFLTLIAFVGQNSLLNRYEHMKEIKELKNQLAQLEKEFEEDNKKLEILNDNPAAIKEVAREKYHMKMDNEDVFFFEETEK